MMVKEWTVPEATSGALPVQVDPVLREILPGYLANRRADAALILSAVDRSDFAEIAVVGHSMRGSGGSYGFAELTALGARIEEAAGLEDGQECHKLAHELTLFLAKIQLPKPQ
jgi:HPt (histidine-containing phosphotransfer) domain-containing protein